MPTQAIVRNAFKLDLASKEHWPLMKEMTKKHGISFWIENTGLYYLALISDEKRLDFFKTFLVIIKQTIRYTNKVPVFYYTNTEYKRHSFLRCVINIEDAQVLQLVLECWLVNLNTDIKDPLTQRLYHASYLVETEDVVLLAKKYPYQFLHFISNLKLVNCSEILNKSYPYLTIFGANKTIVSSCKYCCKTDMWKSVIDNFIETRRLQWFQYFLSYFKKSNETQGKRQVSPQFLPLMNAASREMLNAYIDISMSENSVDIFNNDVGITVNRLLWKRYAYQSHLKQFLLYLFYVALYSYSVYRFKVLIYNYGMPVKILAFAIEAFLLAMTFFYLIQELYQVYREFNDDVAFYIRYEITKPNGRIFFLINKDFWIKVKDHFLQNDIWNINDIAIIGLVFAGTILRIIENKDIFNVDMNPTHQPTNIHSSYLNSTSYPTSQPTMFSTVQLTDSKNVQCIYAVATICVYFKILYFLRPFTTTGPMVSMILQIAKDITAFLFILLTMMCSFAQAFWVLNQNTGTNNPFGTSIWRSYLFSFMFMMGQNVDPDFFADSASFPLNILILNLFMLFMILLMLNLLIALMNDSYGRVREKGYAQWRLEQAGIMLDDTWIPDEKLDPFIYVLKYTSTGNESTTENESFDVSNFNKQLSTIEEKIDKTINSLNNKDTNIDLSKITENSHNLGSIMTVTVGLKNNQNITNIEKKLSSLEEKVKESISKNSNDGGPKITDDSYNLKDIINCIKDFKNDMMDSIKELKNDNNSMLASKK